MYIDIEADESRFLSFVFDFEIAYAVLEVLKYEKTDHEKASLIIDTLSGSYMLRTLVVINRLDKKYGSFIANFIKDSTARHLECFPEDVKAIYGTKFEKLCSKLHASAPAPTEPSKPIDKSLS